MSSQFTLLNASNISHPEGFNLKDIEVLVNSAILVRARSCWKILGFKWHPNINEETWFELLQIVCFVKFQGEGSDNFLSVTGTLYISVNSRKDKRKELKGHILKDFIAPRGFDARIAEIPQKYQQVYVQKVYDVGVWAH